MISIKVDTRELQRSLARLAKDEIPSAIRNALNDTARDVVKREQQEMRRVFKRPRPYLINAIRVTQLATKTKHVAVVGLPDNVESWVHNTLAPHIPGFSAQRKQKAFERALAGYPQNKSGYLVPSRTHPLRNAERGSTVSKMLNDMAAFDKIAGYESTTKRAKRKYFWRTVSKRGGGGTVTGIFEAGKAPGKFGTTTRAPGALKFLVVQKRPSYRKRFEFFRVGKAHAEKVAPKHLRLAIRFAIKRAMRR